MKSHKKLKSGLHALIWKENKWHIAKCVEVEVASQGKTRLEAISNLEEALELFFQDEKVSLPKGLENLEIFPLKMVYA